MNDSGIKTKFTDSQAEISAIGKAIAIEQRSRYIDFRGKRSTFSEFMRRTSDRLIKRHPQDSRWTTIRGLFRQYPNLDLPSRMSIIKRTLSLLIEATATDAPLEPAVTRKNPKPAPETEPVSKKSPRTADNQRDNQDNPKKNNSNPSARPSELAKVEGSDHTQAPENSPKLAGQSSAKGKLESPACLDVQYVRAVGHKMAALLERLNIKSAEDLIRHFPRQHLDFQNHLKISQVNPGEDVTILGYIRSVGAFQAKKGNVSILSISIHDGSGSIGISKFVGGRSNKFLLDRYKAAYPKGAQVMASGRVERDNYSGRLQLKNAEIELIGSMQSHDELESLHTGRLVPVYPLTEGLSLRYLRSIIHNALESFSGSMEDPLPETLRDMLGLVELKTALWGIHFPEDYEQKEEARRRLVFDELFLAQIELAQRRHRFQSENQALSFNSSSKMLETFKEALPFKLTGAQERVFQEIARDLASKKPMHRLVQGDVGSGKTVVAAMSALLAIENGYQVAVMAPTEILAEQHFRQFQKWLSPLGVRSVLLLGKQGVKERRANQQDLLNGQAKVAVGTHALIQEDVEFQNLGFVIIDEQHRFGVKQRAGLKAKGKNPELLTMTATPIPRTLALTVHGDLDVSEIDELPPGRKAITTELIGPGKKRNLYEKIKAEIMLGRQAYIVFPLIEESETLSAKAATAEYETLRSTVFNGISVGLMHGKLKPQEKDEVMEKFRQGEYKILVSTTVIEVGVDVPNATVMVIENADRFGLAQLHQLRGRVGRGADQSYCYLVAEARSEQTRQRLGIMTQTNDGFVIAEKDLELRGPGEFLGVRQSGLPDLVLADIVQDAKILEQARQAAISLIKSDPELEKHRVLKEMLARKGSTRSTELISSG